MVRTKWFFAHRTFQKNIVPEFHHFTKILYVIARYGIFSYRKTVRVAGYPWSVLKPVLGHQLPDKQVGFRVGQCMIDQVFNSPMTSNTVLKKKNKSGIVLVDLTAAYDNVWHQDQTPPTTVFVYRPSFKNWQKTIKAIFLTKLAE